MALTDGPSTVIVRLIRRPGDKEAPVLQDEMLASNAMAIKKGTLELNKLFYKVKALSVSCIKALNENITDGEVILIDSERFDVRGLYILKGREITITPTSMIETITAERYEKP